MVNSSPEELANARSWESAIMLLRWLMQYTLENPFLERHKASCDYRLVDTIISWFAKMAKLTSIFLSHSVDPEGITTMHAQIPDAPKVYQRSVRQLQLCPSRYPRSKFLPPVNDISTAATEFCQ